MSFSAEFLKECRDIINVLSTDDIERVVDLLVKVRDRDGRLFIIGSGGGAGHSSHAVCDFRKLCNFEAYAPYDNISELTARVNDEGWAVSLVNWLKGSRLNANDCLLVFSVGGGSLEKNISPNLVKAIKYAKRIGTAITGIVGKDGGYTNQIGDAVIVVPVVDPSRITPHTEGFQAVIWHLLVSHPKLQMNPTKWESTK